MRGAVWVLAFVLIAPGCRRKPDEEAPEPDEPDEPAAAVVTKNPVRIVYPAAPGSFVDLAAKIADSVVNIRATRPVAGGPGSLIPGAVDKESLGSGFIISNDGHILTCDHFIARVGDVEVRLRSGETYPATIVGRDARLDVALLKIEAPPPLPVVRQGSSDDLQVGEWIVAVGNPFGPEVVVTAGVVGGLGLTDFSGAAASTPTLENFLTTDARVTAMHAGGPVLNTAGEVVGIATVSEAGGGGIGFAVPIDRAKLILPMLKENGSVQRAWIGIYVREVDDARRALMELPTRAGALVTDVVGSGPGHSAGIARGDVIVEFDGSLVNHRNLPGHVATAGINRTIELVVVRDGARKTLNITTTPMPE